MDLTFFEGFKVLRRRNKVLFTLIVATLIVVFWKGVWGLTDIVFDEWLFRDHLFWSNLAAIIISIILLSGAGVLLEKIA